MTSIEFMHVKLSGGRFDDENPSLSVFENLIDLQKLVIKIAKQSHKEQHGQLDGQSKSDFDSTYFSIRKLEKGSTVVSLGLGIDRPILDVGTMPNEKHLGKASNIVVNVIESDDQIITHVNGLFDAYKSYLENAKKKLKAGEIIEITTADQQTARLTTKICDRLLEYLSYYTIRDTTIEGNVSEVDRKRMHFRLDMTQGGTVDCPLDDQYLGIILEALRYYKEKHDYRVVVRAACRYDQLQKLKGVDSVVSVMPLSATATGVRLDGFRSLQDGWLPEGGKAPSHDGLAWLKGVFERYYPADLSPPYTYPTPDGGVSLEWSAGIRDVDIEVDLEKHTGLWYVFNKDTRKGEGEKSLNLDDPGEWKWVAKQLRGLME